MFLKELKELLGNSYFVFSKNFLKVNSMKKEVTDEIIKYYSEMKSVRLRV